MLARFDPSSSADGSCCSPSLMPMVFDVLVEVRLRAGIADPQGATIERSLPTLGYDSVRDVRVGKAIRRREPRWRSCARGS